MVRTLTSAATAEKNLRTTAVPLYVLEVRFGGATGTKYYSDQEFSGFPITVDPRVKEWGDVQTSAEVGKVGGYGTVTIKLFDVDHSLKQLFEAKPGRKTESPTYTFGLPEPLGVIG